MHQTITRTAQAAIAAGLMTFAMASPAQAHTVSVGNAWGSAQLTSNHAQLNICRVLGRYPASDVWATVRFGTGFLHRYDAPPVPSLCYQRDLPSSVTEVRFCWRPSGTDNNCTAWRAA
ncbi:hypothetical protein ACIBO5_56325 [Nonomuraea angiospora]|uniref:hypothetical protein n=1 Tax=Nonomuraea angiospora TaxID=46172 RepID=UPI0029AE5DE2|nr:hypothetical protein [Nonomuraea angiospora]MDX3101473.1 hypothetical protein [Nonomuraea angiospora]